jgi:hypothetical protein
MSDDHVVMIVAAIFMAANESRDKETQEFCIQSARLLLQRIRESPKDVDVEAVRAFAGTHREAERRNLL